MGLPILEIIDHVEGFLTGGLLWAFGREPGAPGVEELRKETVWGAMYCPFGIFSPEVEASVSYFYFHE